MIDQPRTESINVDNARAHAERRRAQEEYDLMHPSDEEIARRELWNLVVRDGRLVPR